MNEQDDDSHLAELLAQHERNEAVIEATGVWQAVQVIKAIRFWTDDADAFVETPLYRAVKELIISAAERGGDIGYILAALEMDLELSPGHYRDLREETGPEPVTANQFGGPDQITVHIFDGDGDGPGQHLGSITFPDWVAFGGDPEDQPTEREMAARAWNFMIQRSEDAVLGAGIAITGRDDAMPTRGCLGGGSDGCWGCLVARHRFPVLWAAILEIRDAQTDERGHLHATKVEIQAFAAGPVAAGSLVRDDGGREL